MHSSRAVPAPPTPDVYDFSQEEDDGKVFLGAAVSPLMKYIQTEHQHAGLYALPHPDTHELSTLLATSRKKRRRCGLCAPCRRTENCGTCSSCLNRKIGHQICKLRKCDELKKKRDPSQTVSGVGAVDGPRGSVQMENDHDRLETGVLHQESTGGLSRHAGNGEEASSLEAGALDREQQNHRHQEALACLPQTQGWCPVGGVQEQAGWNNQTSGSSANSVDMEDARTLVAFSASAGSLPPCSVSQPSPNLTAQLYEKFSQEMASRGDDAKQKSWSGDGEPCTPEDLSKLQTALSQARHGHKPPNCDCEGPECPDYLEWLEKKIKMAAESQDKGLCKMAGAPHLQHYHSEPHTQPTTTSASCGSELQSPNTIKQPPVPRSYGPPPPIPCSPSVLSIAKERNVSLQTAIAIEALTQLSGTTGAVSESALNSHRQASTHNPSQSQNGMRLVPSSPGPLPSSSSSPMPQAIPPGHFSHQTPTSWEQSRPQSQGPAHHSSQYSTSTSPFPNSCQQWQQGAGASCEKNSPRNPWMMLNADSQPCFPHPSNCGGSDPMSELKQLLGDSNGKYAKTAFKFPAPPHGLKDGHKVSHLALPHVKQEVDHGDYPDQASCAAVSQYGIVNGQQQYLSQQHALSIRHSTQAALQQHLNHKRNLFSSPQPFSPRVPNMCQTLRKWWPQTTGESPLDIKQEPKKKKNSQSSPLLKQSMSGLLGVLGSPLPKPKQIVIKKSKQKASQPTFLPKSQIAIQKPPPCLPASAPSLPSFTPSLPGMEVGFPSCLPTYNPSQVAASQAPPAQSQESILNSSSIPISGNNPLAPAPMSIPASPAPEGQISSGLAEAGEGTLLTTSTLQTSASQPTPPLPGLGSLDPKFEDLIRQFEEEFGDASPSVPVAGATERGPAPPVVTESQPNSNSGLARPQSPSTEQQLKNPLGAPAGQAEPIPEGEKDEEHQDGKHKDDTVEKEEAPVSSGLLPAIKQEAEPCDIDVKPSSQFLHQTQELYLQQQQHRVLVDPFTTPFSPPNKRVKIESSGGLTVLSTTGSFSMKGEDLDTPTKDGFPVAPSLKGFLESPMRYLDTPTKSLLDTPVKDSQSEFPTCNCVDQIVEKDEGPYYNHLGSGPSVASIREIMESRSGEKGDAIRIEKVIFTGREGKSSQGCPIAKWVIRRASEKEKLMCLVRHRAGHHCAHAVIIILIMCWEGVPRAIGDKLYREVSDTLTKYGIPTSRRCGLNEDRTCACQGKDTDLSGASFSFGCSWSMYFNGCKYARSKLPRKFRLQGEHPEEEELLRNNFQDLATRVAPVYQRLAPQAYSNQCAHEKAAPDCRLGLQEGRPFSGITACMDFCAHAHKDQHNLHNGCTVVCTLTKEDNRQVGVIPDDEQLHVLPLYKVSLTDEFGSEENQRAKMRNGAIQVLSRFRREVRKLPEPAKSCRQRRLEAKKAASEKKIKKQQVSDTPEKIIKKEVHHVVAAEQQEGNKAIPKQEVKPTIKKQLVDRFQAVNGALNGYSALGNGKMCADPYAMNAAYPSFTGPYARGGLSSSSQPAVNGFHPNPQGMPYNYYNYPASALLPQELLGYEGRSSPWGKSSAVDQKPDMQDLQARLAQAYPPRPEQQRQQAADMAVAPGYPHQSELSASPAPPGRASSVPPDQLHRTTPIIKQEPAEVPLFDSRPDGMAQSCPSTPSVTPQPDGWHGHKPNGGLPSKAWDGSARPGTPHAALRPDKQRLQQQQHPVQAQHSPYPHPQRQWSSYPGTSVSSPAPSLSPSPAPSPHPATPNHWESLALNPQAKSWGPLGPSVYGPAGLRQASSIGAFPDKMLSQAAESRGSTPLGLQEKACKSGGASVAGSTPSPAPEGRLFPDALQKVDGQACWDGEMQSHSQRDVDDEEEEVWSDSEHNFLDPNIGGVAVAPAHGSILIECAKRELHATTPLKRPDRSHPTRISLVFYQHKNLNQPSHGLALWEAKMKMLAERAKQRQQEAALLGLSQEDIKAYGKKRKWADGAASLSSGATKDRRDGMVTRVAPTQHTTTTVTVSPYAFTQLTGPYSRFM